MRLISLNLWGGKQQAGLNEYLVKNLPTTDIFCFQEVFDSAGEVYDIKGSRPHLLEELKNTFKDYQPFYFPNYFSWIENQKVNFSISEGQAIFVKNGIKILEQGFKYIYGGTETEILPDFTNEPKGLIYCVIELNAKPVLIVNVHGKWYPGDKTDTPERLEQSKIILELVKKYNGAKIVCGDFNLLPETQSVKMLEGELVNLINKFKVENTRNEHSWKQYNNQQHFADYTFASPEVKINSFEVPYNLISDHLPMELEFDL